MEDILSEARKNRRVIAREAVAHRLSAEYHRSRHMMLGVIATIVTTLVGGTIFTGLANQLGLAGDGTLRLPSGGWAVPGYLAFALLLISAPVLTGLQTFLNHAEAAETHKTSAADYEHLRERFDVFLLRYEKDTGTRDKALEALEELNAEWNQVRKRSLTMPKKAYEDADKEMERERLQSGTSYR